MSRSKIADDCSSRTSVTRDEKKTMHVSDFQILVLEIDLRHTVKKRIGITKSSSRGMIRSIEMSMKMFVTWLHPEQPEQFQTMSTDRPWTQNTAWGLFAVKFANQKGQVSRRPRAAQQTICLRWDLRIPSHSKWNPQYWIVYLVSFDTESWVDNHTLVMQGRSGVVQSVRVEDFTEWGHVHDPSAEGLIASNGD